MFVKMCTRHVLSLVLLMRFAYLEQINVDSEFYVVSTTEQPNDKNVSIFHKQLELETIIEEYNRRINTLELQSSQILKLLEEQRKANVKLNEDLERKLEKIQKLPKSCKELLERGISVSGVYTIQPKSEIFNVFCDMVTRGGGWTVILNRFDGSQNFDLDWVKYEEGFGNLESEFWIGLKRIYELTEVESQHNNTELLVEMLDPTMQQKSHAYYKGFSIASAQEGYKLKLVQNSYHGDAGDSLKVHNGLEFSTKDRDRDNWHDGNRALDYGGGWWFSIYSESNLNGRYLKKPPIDFYHRGIHWHTLTFYDQSLIKAKMMVRSR